MEERMMFKVINKGQLKIEKSWVLIMVFFYLCIPTLKSGFSLSAHRFSS
jgi:hypothetical protein